MKRIILALLIALAPSVASAQTLLARWIGPAYSPSASTAVGDETGNGRTGTASRNTNLNSTTGPGGKIPLAYNANGSSDLITVANHASLNTSLAAFTLAAWIKADATSGKYVLCEFGGTSFNHNLHISSNTLYGGVFGGSTTAAYGSVAFTSTAWRHVAVTFVGGSAVRLYVDAVEVGTDTTSVPANTGSPTDGNGLAGSPDVGNGSDWASAAGLEDNAPAYFDGAMADVRFYGGALTQTQIVAIMAEASSGGLLLLLGDIQPRSLFDRRFTLDKRYGGQVYDLAL